jgi:hypothetical protein
MKKGFVEYAQKTGAEFEQVVQGEAKRSETGLYKLHKNTRIKLMLIVQ